MNNINLAIKKRTKRKFVLYTSQKKFFIGLGKDIQIFLGRLNKRYQIFVIENREYNCMLDQLCFNFVKFNDEYMSNKILSTISYQYMY